MIRIAKAISPTSRSSGVTFVGPRGGRFGPCGPRRSVLDDSCVGGSSSKKSKSMSVSCSLTPGLLQEKVGSLYRLRRPGQDSRPRVEIRETVAEAALALSSNELVAGHYRPLRPL